MYNKKGFTLLELAIGLIVLSIILITSNTLMNNLINAQKYEETINEVTKIGRAISGDPDIMQTGHQAGFGYIELHRNWPIGFPATALSLLYEFIHDPMSVRQIGGTVAWHDLLQDEWGNGYTGAMGAFFTITSTGEDGAVGGGDDIQYQLSGQMHFANQVRIFNTDAQGTILRGTHNTAIPDGCHSIFIVDLRGYGAANAQSLWAANGTSTGFGGLGAMTYDNGFFETTSVMTGFYQVSVSVSQGTGGAGGMFEHSDNLTGANAGNANLEDTIRKMIVVYPRGNAVDQYFEVRFPGVMEPDEIGINQVP